ncbi:MAG: hypothetical protein KF754_07845 [Planctomycetes bacterium]|nr:hypothetical protein [Planctomycetota bacterium]
MVHHRLFAGLAAIVLAACAGSSLKAAPLDPTAFTSLGTLTMPAGTYTIDTTAMTMTGGSINFTGVASGNICVFTFASINIQAGAVITCLGTRTLALLSQSTCTIAGTINANGESTQAGFIGYNARGGPGGGAGGLSGDLTGYLGGPTFNPQNGSGPGGGLCADQSGGAGGGGFGTGGARGGDANGYQGQAGGAAYGDLANLLEGGSGGGGADLASGGGGGGGVEVGATGDISIPTGGSVTAKGGDGETGNYGASGGGSGGGIYVHTPALLTLGGTLDVRGGGGGTGGC